MIWARAIGVAAEHRKRDRGADVQLHIQGFNSTHDRGDDRRAQRESIKFDGATENVEETRNALRRRPENSAGCLGNRWWSFRVAFELWGVSRLKAEHPWMSGLERLT